MVPTPVADLKDRSTVTFRSKYNDEKKRNTVRVGHRNPDDEKRSTVSFRHKYNDRKKKNEIP